MIDQHVVHTTTASDLLPICSRCGGWAEGSERCLLEQQAKVKGDSDGRDMGTSS